MILKRLAGNDRRGVINMSLGGSFDFSDFIYDYFIEEIVRNGGIVVVAAGNEADDACAYGPAFSHHAISVGASFRNNTHFAVCTIISHVYTIHAHVLRYRSLYTYNAYTHFQNCTLI